MKNIFKTLGLAFMAGALFSSCLKDDSLTLDTGKSNNVTEFGNNGSPLDLPKDGAPVRYGIDLGTLKDGQSSTFHILVGYAGSKLAPENMTVTVDLDNSLLTTYNDVHSVDGADFEIPPMELFGANFPVTITIPKGKQFGELEVPFKLDASKWDFDADYALPLKITKTSVGIVSGNFGTALYSLNIRNIFDGQFKVTGTFVDQTNGNFVAAYPKTINLMTLGASSNGYYDVGLNGGTFGYRFLNGSAGTYYGSFAPVFNFDNDGNVISVVNYFGQPSGNGRSAQLDPSGVNKMTFDAAGKPKELKVSYFMLQPGSTVRSKFNETFTYIGPR